MPCACLISRAFVEGAPSLVELTLRQRAAEAEDQAPYPESAGVPQALPNGEASWAQYLFWLERLRAANPRSRGAVQAGDTGMRPRTGENSARGFHAWGLGCQTRIHARPTV